MKPKRTNEGEVKPNKEEGKMKKMMLIEGYDGELYRIKPAHGTIQQWRDGKCWHFACANQILYVHLSTSGLATHGYCPHLRPTWLYQQDPRGMWYMLVKGKMEEVKRPKESVAKK